MFESIRYFTRDFFTKLRTEVLLRVFVLNIFPYEFKKLGRVIHKCGVGVKMYFLPTMTCLENIR